MPTPIESIQPGDSVWSYDQSSHEWQVATLENTHAREYFGDMVRLEISISDGSSNRTESIDCTGGHPFWVVSGVQLDERPVCTELPIHDSQMTPSGRWTEARWLRLGDRFLTRTGASATVSGLTIRTERVQVYNLHVKDLQLYAVGESGVLVHNSRGAIVRKAAPPGAGPITNTTVAAKTYRGPWGWFRVAIRRNGDVVITGHPKGTDVFMHQVWKDGKLVHFHCD